MKPKVLINCIENLTKLLTLEWKVVKITVILKLFDRFLVANDFQIVTSNFKRHRHTDRMGYHTQNLAGLK